MRAPHVKSSTLLGKKADVRRSRPLIRECGLRRRAAAFFPTHPEAVIASHRISMRVIPPTSSWRVVVGRGDPRTSSYPCRLQRANTTSSVRTKRRHDAWVLGSFFSLGR